MFFKIAPGVLSLHIMPISACKSWHCAGLTFPQCTFLTQKICLLTFLLCDADQRCHSHYHSHHFCGLDCLLHDPSLPSHSLHLDRSGNHSAVHVPCGLCALLCYQHLRHAAAVGCLPQGLRLWICHQGMFCLRCLVHCCNLVASCVSRLAQAMCLDPISAPLLPQLKPDDPELISSVHECVKLPMECMSAWSCQ